MCALVPGFSFGLLIFRSYQEVQGLKLL